MSGTWADLFNSPTELEFEGKMYKLRQLDGVEEGVYQRWLEKRMRDSVGRETELDEDRRRTLDKDVNEAIGLGEYEYGSEACVKSLQRKSGMLKALSIILRDQGLNEKEVERFYKQHQKEIALVLVSRITTDPKSLRAAAIALGLPEDFVLRPDATSSSDSAIHPSTTTSGTSEASPTTSEPSSSPSSGGQTESPS